MPGDQMVQLNYVIPDELESLLTRYCEQNLASPSALIRRLIGDYLDGTTKIGAVTHPRGRRTTVALPEKLLFAFEEKIFEEGHRTKAAVIAALLSKFLPSRVLSDSTMRVEATMPTEVFNKIYEVYGPGPVDAVVVTALSDLARTHNQSKITEEVG